MKNHNRDKILKFLRRENLAVLSYAENGQPKSSVVDYSEDEDLQIIFITLLKYRKYSLIKKNPRISLCIGGKNNITVQYEGIAKELTRLKFLPYLKYHIKKNPVELKFSKMLEAKFFIIKPTWIRYSDFSAKPNEIFEITYE